MINVLIDKKETAVYLLRHDRFLLLMHASPDGDTVGSAAGLALALRDMGKQANILCFDTIPAKYHYISQLGRQDFAPQTVIAVDVADEKLLGAERDIPGGVIHLCIDHHPSNKRFAERTLLCPGAAATAEIIYELILELGCEITPEIAAALYTGIATDTGCFKFSNTTPETHRIAGELMATGIDYAEINRVMFELKSRARIALEREALQNIVYAADGKCALLTVTSKMLEETSAADDELDGITALPRQIEGVIIGLTLREKEPGRYKLSARTHAPVDAGALCALFGGGGHARAAGCEIAGTPEEVTEKVLSAAKNALRDLG